MEETDKSNKQKEDAIIISTTQKKELCDTCEGIGFTKSEPIYVKNVKYVPCKPCGTIRKPYDICDDCYGTGRKED